MAGRVLHAVSIQVEQGEVVLTNLLMLQHPTEEKFIISHDDIVVSIEAAIG